MTYVNFHFQNFVSESLKMKLLTIRLEEAFPPF